MAEERSREAAEAAVRAQVRGLNNDGFLLTYDGFILKS